MKNATINYCLDSNLCCRARCPIKLGTESHQDILLSVVGKASTTRTVAMPWSLKGPKSGVYARAMQKMERNQKKIRISGLSNIQEDI
jgi:hypothetical protein